MGECFSSEPGEPGREMDEDFVATLLYQGHELLITEHCLERVSVRRYDSAHARYNHVSMVLDDQTPALCFADMVGGFAKWTERDDVRETIGGEPDDEVRIHYWDQRSDLDDLTEQEQAERDHAARLKLEAEAARVINDAGDLDDAASSLLS